MASVIPQQVCDRAELLCRVHPAYVAADIIGINRTTVYYIKKRGFREADYAGSKRPIPSDFSIIARHRTKREIMAHYRAGPIAVARWLKERPRPRFKPGKVRQQEASR